MIFVDFFCLFTFITFFLSSLALIMSPFCGNLPHFISISILSHASKTIEERSSIYLLIFLVILYR